MRYANPVIFSDYSDPDVIRVGEDFYMVASSFNFVPGVPVLHSKNLVEWELINYVLPEIPFHGYEEANHGNGAWAPSLRFHGGKFYCLIPFPDEGIFVSETQDIYGEWSPLRPLLLGKGFIDPCPIWEDNRCHVAFAFARSRAGFNSKIALFETDENLQAPAKKYDIIYFNPDISPVIEGPKLYKRGKYFYILAPAGGVKTGWQVALRSKKLKGPYETKIVLIQGSTEVNGPHQGALVDLDDKGERWAFLHFQDLGAYGRVVHLQPAKWADDWVILGEETYDNMAGNPAKGGEYPVNIKTDYKIQPSDEFDGKTLSPIWQTPANRRDGWCEIKGGMKLNCAYYGGNSLANAPQLFLQKVLYENFSIKTKCKLNLKEDGDEAGFIVFGREYGYVCVVRSDGQNYLEIRKGSLSGGGDEALCRSQPYGDGYVTFQMTARRVSPETFLYKFTFGGSAFTHKFYATPAVWTGARVGVYARSSAQSDGFATFKFFRVTQNKHPESRALSGGAKGTD